VPIYNKDKDSIVGILTLRETLRLYQNLENHAKQLKSFTLQEVEKVPVTANIFEMFIKMKKHGQHMAIVVDEY
jgi:CBS domain containing-hemolysin-like protein